MILDTLPTNIFCISGPAGFRVHEFQDPYYCFQYVLQCVCVHACTHTRTRACVRTFASASMHTHHPKTRTNRNTHTHHPMQGGRLGWLMRTSNLKLWVKNKVQARVAHDYTVWQSFCCVFYTTWRPLLMNSLSTEAAADAAPQNKAVFMITPQPYQHKCVPMR